VERGGRDDSISWEKCLSPGCPGTDLFSLPRRRLAIASRHLRSLLRPGPPDRVLRSPVDRAWHAGPKRAATDACLLRRTRDRPYDQPWPKMEFVGQPRASGLLEGVGLPRAQGRPHLQPSLFGQAGGLAYAPGDRLRQPLAGRTLAASPCVKGIEGFIRAGAWGADQLGGP